MTGASSGHRLADDLPAVFMFALALAFPVLLWSATRLWSEWWRGTAGLFGEVFAVVTVAEVLTRYTVVPALQWLSVRMP